MAGSPRSERPVLRLRVGQSQFSLLPERTLVGRSRSCDVRIKDDTVSRLHAALLWSGDILTLEDLGSSNGTYLNGERLEHPTRLKSGDEIRFGGVSVQVEAPGTTPAPPTGPPQHDYTVGLIPGRPAALGRRLVAVGLDGFLFLLGSLVPFGPWIAIRLTERYLLAPNALPPAASTHTVVGAGCVVLWLVYAWYYILHGWARRAGTPGLRLAGLRLVNDEMRAPIGYRQALLRVLGSALTVATLGLGFITVARRPDRRALHDIVAHTLVVDRPRPL